MNYKQTIEYLFTQLPVYQRTGNAKYKIDLDNTIKLCNILDNPQNNFKSIHIAGTNGKGSTAHTIASILQTKNLKTGLYTSPHIKSFRERIKINGHKIPKKYVCSFINKYKEKFESLKLSFFEMTVGMAFKYFSDKKIDIAVIETGLGGRLDSTNIITPLISVITNIGLDHTDLLGNTIKKIAYEKSGIIKHKIPVIIGETQNKIKSIFVNTAKQQNAPVFFADTIYKPYNIKISENNLHKKMRLTMDISKNNKLFIKNLNSELLGLYESKNIVTVLQAIELLNKIGYNISKTDILKGIDTVFEQTVLMGRWQIMSKSPLTICDVAHNEDGIKQIVKQLSVTKYENLHFVFGMVKDKDIAQILKLLPQKATYYFCKANIPRALDQNKLLKKAKENNLTGIAYPSVENAFLSAKSNAKKNDLVFVSGSTFIVAEVIPLYS